MPDYAKGKIYEILCITTGYCYIGSTVQTLRARLNGHKASYNKFLNGKANNCTSYACLINDNYCIKLIEDYPCESKKELLRREGYWQLKRKCVNRCIAGRTRQEHADANRELLRSYDKNRNGTEKRLQSRKDHYYRNKDKILAKHKEILVCECGVKITRRCLTRHKRSKRHIKRMENT